MTASIKPLFCTSILLSKLEIFSKFIGIRVMRSWICHCQNNNDNKNSNDDVLAAYHYLHANTLTNCVIHHIFTLTIHL